MDFFALCGGSELRSLQRQQITVEKLSSGERYLLYKKWAQRIALEELNIVSLHGPAGNLYSVASASPIHVPPVQHALKHCCVYIYIYIHTRM